MSSRGKNFRRRSEIADANGDEKSNPSSSISAAVASSSSSTRNAAQQGNPRAPSSCRLSFDDGEEEDVPASTTRSASNRRTPSSSSSSAVRPPAASSSIHKLTRTTDRRTAAAASHHGPIPSNFQSPAGEYSKEKLLDLQKNARPLHSKSSQTMPPSESKLPKSEVPSAEPVIILKGLVKPVSDSDPGKKHREKIQDDDDDWEKEAEDNQFMKLSTINKKKMAGALPPIPDQEMIKAIRAKKEQLRQSRGAAPDYISLDGGGLMTTRASSDGGSSDDDEEVSAMGRMALFGDDKDAHKKKGVFEGIDDQMVTEATEAKIQDVGGLGDMEDDEDEEERKWEEAQFRKGLGKRIVDDVPPNHMATGAIPPAPPVQPTNSVFLGAPHQAFTTGAPIAPSIGFFTNSETLTIFQQAEVATRAFQDNFDKMKQTHTRTLNSLAKVDENLSESLHDIITLETSLKDAGDKFLFTQKLRHFVSIMCDFLQDKASLIEELEEQMQKLHEKRAFAISERRDADAADESGSVEAAISAAMGVLVKGSGSAAISAAMSAAQAAAAAVRDRSNLQVQLDEFGRDVNLQKRMDLERRAEARRRRKAKFDAKMMSCVASDGKYQRIEGESSTDESDSEGSAYKSSLDELLHHAKLIFSDAADAYSNLSEVKNQFEKWKKQYPQSYRDAYMSLSAPAIFCPFVRVELLGWDPLYEPVDFNNMNWHEELFDYGFPGEGLQQGTDDADDNLVPILVEKVAVPILRHEIEHCWDVLSTKRTENAVYATAMVVNYNSSPSSEVFLKLLAVVQSRLFEAIAGLNVPTWDHVVMSAVPGAARLAAYRFGVSVRLLKNVCLWKDIFALPVLEKLVLDELLNKKLLPHIRSIMQNIHDAIARMERIVANMSGVWYGPGIAENHSRNLLPLVECVMLMSRRLERRQSSGASEEETRALARRLKKMLVELNEYDRARSVMRTFQLKEAL